MTRRCVVRCAKVSDHSQQHTWLIGGEESSFCTPSQTASLMTRAVLVGLVDRTPNHWARASPLDGGEDEDADTGSDTTVLDYSDAVAYFSSQQTATSDVPNL